MVAKQFSQQAADSIYRHDTEEVAGQLRGASSLRAMLRGRFSVGAGISADSAVEDDPNREEEFPEDGVEPEEDDEFDDEDDGSDGDWDEDEEEDEEEEEYDDDEEYEEEDDDEEYEEEEPLD